jgi:hypothetical protein
MMQRKECEIWHRTQVNPIIDEYGNKSPFQCFFGGEISQFVEFLFQEMKQT